MAQLPGPVRAALGLIATVVQDGPNLPDKALELPVLAVSTALQISLRAQQRYAALTARGDQLIAELRGGAPEEPPAWATFDDDSSDTADALPSAATDVARPATGMAGSADDLVRAADEVAGPADDVAGEREPKPTSRKSDSERKPRTRPAKAAKTAAPKSVRSPRKGKPSAFDTAEPIDTPEPEAAPQPADASEPGETPQPPDASGPSDIELTEIGEPEALEPDSLVPEALESDALESDSLESDSLESDALESRATEDAIAEALILDAVVDSLVKDAVEKLGGGPSDESSPPEPGDE